MNVAFLPVGRYLGLIDDRSALMVGPSQVLAPDPTWHSALRVVARPMLDADLRAALDDVGESPESMCAAGFLVRSDVTAREELGGLTLYPTASEATWDPDAEAALLRRGDQAMLALGAVARCLRSLGSQALVDSLDPDHPDATAVEQVRLLIDRDLAFLGLPEAADG
jgi:hypothetical protein